MYVAGASQFRYFLLSLRTITLLSNSFLSLVRLAYRFHEDISLAYCIELSWYGRMHNKRISMPFQLMCDTNVWHCFYLYIFELICNTNKVETVYLPLCFDEKIIYAVVSFEVSLCGFGGGGWGVVWMWSNWRHPKVYWLPRPGRTTQKWLEHCSKLLLQFIVYHEYSLCIAELCMRKLRALHHKLDCTKQYILIMILTNFLNTFTLPSQAHTSYSLHFVHAVLLNTFFPHGTYNMQSDFVPSMQNSEYSMV